MTTPLRLDTRMQIVHPSWVLGSSPNLTLVYTKHHYCPSYTITNKLVKKAGTNNNIHFLLVEFPHVTTAETADDLLPASPVSPTTGRPPPRLQVPSPPYLSPPSTTASPVLFSALAPLPLSPLSPSGLISVAASAPPPSSALPRNFWAASYMLPSSPILPNPSPITAGATLPAPSPAPLPPPFRPAHALKH